MDGSAFDHLTRTFNDAQSRRDVSRLLGGLAVGGPLMLLGDAESTAKKRKKPCPPCKKRKKGTCKANVADGTACDGGSNRVCEGGACVCAGVTCGDRCCLPGQICLSNGSCAHPCTSSEFPAPDCPCANSICAPVVGGGTYCTLPMAPDSCGASCTTSAGCGQGRVCHSLGFGTCPLGLHCVPLCNG